MAVHTWGAPVLGGEGRREDIGMWRGGYREDQSSALFPRHR
jgi:hypothetical protein